MSNSLQEKLLLYRIRAKRDPEAFGKLYDAYVKRIYRFVYFKVQSAEEAQDITSDTFLKLWQYLIEGKKVEHVGALLYQISRNAIVDNARKRRPESSIDAVDGLMQIPDVSGLSNIYRSAELSQVLTAVKLLKDEYREVLTMRYVDGISPKEIAVLVGKNPGHVRVLLHRALETVRVLLSSSQDR